MAQPNYHTVRATSAADITLPRSGLWLAQVRVFNGTTAGAFQYRYEGSAQALFMGPSNGTIGQATYRVKHQFKGTLIPSGTQTFTGGAAAVELIFTDQPPATGYTLEQLRGVVSQRVDAGAVSAAVTFTYDVAPATPKKVIAYISASRGRVTFPAIDQLTPQVEMIRSDRFEEDDMVPAPPFSPSNTLAPTVVSDAAATVLVGIYY